MRVKICGIQPGDDLSFADTDLIAHVGFIFVSASRRYVHPRQVPALIRSLPASCSPVGVVVDEEFDGVRQICDEAQIRHVQLHGRETPDFCQRLKNDGYTVWKSFSVPETVDENVAVVIANRIRPYLQAIDGILLDSAPPAAEGSVTGGHGRRFAWSILPRLVDALGPEEMRPPLWIAGGIRPENVDECLACFVPDGLDVSSGVEVNGRKSRARIDALVGALRSAARRQGCEAESKQAVNQ
ncbi:phosphoribosylanthranilate isomerase [Alicyclobacillus shizuokensis]|uniref:phosphoribosylanthranilate isomerase n=1 Tax=Alicyclobacillus shizuokensis TaxID=392014 RepID=UPI001FE19741|nr:phosphoribosylanthranilate isomerase [Alicyclobacillus shizuokensis]